MLKTPHSPVLGIYPPLINYHLNNLFWKLSNQILQIFMIGSHLHLQNLKYFPVSTGNFSPVVPEYYICPLFTVALCYWILGIL